MFAHVSTTLAELGSRICGSDVHEPLNLTPLRSKSSLNMENQVTRDNHYVPQSYLRRWSSEKEKVWVSRLLVPDSRMPLWKLASIRGIAKHQNLYTRVVTESDSDEIERWLNEGFETPAQASIDRAVMEQELTESDWITIIRFVAAQDARTPARLQENMKRWQRDLQSTIDEVLENAVRKLREAQKTGVRLASSKHPYADYFPIKVVKEILPDAESGTLQVQTIAGRGLWLFSLKHVLTNTLKVLHNHKWTILHCPSDMAWMTSDNPVVKLNFHSPQDYSFNGGWGSKGTEIFMPLSPKHLLYARVGFCPPAHGTVLSEELAHWFQRFIVGNAYRFIFAAKPDERLLHIRQRHVSAEAYASEIKQWANWHDEQRRAELDLLRR